MSDSSDVVGFWIVVAIVVVVLFFRPDGCRKTLASEHRFRAGTVEQYRERATACEKIAASTISGEHRRRLLEIARSWQALADQRARMLKEAPEAPPFT